MATMTATGRKRIYTLLDESSEGKVLVVRRDADRFIMTAQEAVEACHAASESIRFSIQFGDLLDFLGKWIEEHRPKIHRAQVAVRESDLLFLVTQSGVAYDNELMEKLAELDIEVANHEKFSLVRLNVLAIPRSSDDALTAFVSGRENDCWTYAKP